MAGLGEGSELDGETAFKLLRHLRLPLDLTQDALRQKNIGVDTDGFSKAMARQKAEARANWSGSGEARPKRSGFEIKEDKGRDGIPRLRRRARRRRGSGAGARRGSHRGGLRRRGGCRSSSTRRRSTASPAARWATRRDPVRRRQGCRVRHAEEGRRPVRALRTIETGVLKPGAAVVLEVDHIRRGKLRSNHSPPTSSMRRCAKCWEPMWRRRARWSRPSACVSTSRIPSR